MYQYPTAFLYGFKPFLHYPTNITAAVIAEVEKEKLAPNNVFPVEFQREMFLQEYEKHRPTLIIGMGQMERAQKIRIERRAINRTSGGNPITPSGAPVKYVNLKIPKTPESTITYDAGDYVCNYSMYVSTEYSEAHNTQYAFLHIPLKATVPEVLTFLKETLREC